MSIHLQILLTVFVTAVVMGAGPIGLLQGLCLQHTGIKNIINKYIKCK